MEEKTNLTEWITEKGRIDEPCFCEKMADNYGIICMNGKFYNIMGEIEPQKLERIIYNQIKPYAISGTARKVKSILETLKNHRFPLILTGFMLITELCLLMEMNSLHLLLFLNLNSVETGLTLITVLKYGTVFTTLNIF